MWVNIIWTLTASNCECLCLTKLFIEINMNILLICIYMLTYIYMYLLYWAVFEIWFYFIFIFNVYRHLTYTVVSFPLVCLLLKTSRGYQILWHIQMIVSHFVELSSVPFLLGQPMFWTLKQINPSSSHWNF